MRKVTFGGAVSLDNFLAGPAESLDWLRWSDEAQAISAASWQGVDTILMGRKTFEFAMRSGGGGDAGNGGMTTYVFSRTLAEVPAGAVLVREDAGGFVRRLKARPGGDIIVMGGGALGSALIEAGAVDEIGINIHPLLLGGGTALFLPFRRPIELALVEARPIARQCLFVRYRVIDPDAPDTAARPSRRRAGNEKGGAERTAPPV